MGSLDSKTEAIRAANVFLGARARSLSEGPEGAWDNVLTMYAARLLRGFAPEEIESWKLQWLARLAAERSRRRARKPIQDHRVTSRRAGGSKKRRKLDPALVRLRQRVRELYDARLDQEEICRKLNNEPRPPGAQWRDLSWPAAYRHPLYRGAVKKWLTAASRSH